jgi:membrane protease YdiL (CAAX protease family)
VTLTAHAVFHTRSGRLRVGWRLLLFAGLFAALFVLLAGVLPGSLWAQPVVLLGASLLAGWALLALDGRPPAALGLPLGRQALGESARGLVLGCVVAGAAVLPMAVLGVVRWSSEGGGAAAFLEAGALSLALYGPLAAAEEALLRGYPLQALAEAWGPRVALVLTSATFGALHAANPGAGWVGILNTGLAGVFLGALYLRTGSLWWVSGAHAGWNWAHGFLLDLPVSGLDVADQPLLEARAQGPELLSGGAFGPEGSLLTTGVLLAAAAWTWRTPLLAPAAWTRETPPLARLLPERARSGATTLTRGST